MKLMSKKKKKKKSFQILFFSVAYIDNHFIMIMSGYSHQSLLIYSIVIQTSKTLGAKLAIYNSSSPSLIASVDISKVIRNKQLIL